MMMLEGANLLVFDEPTNHLDVESIEALEDAIEAFEGTVLLVSHDRALLRALTTRVWSLENGRIEDFGGGFEDWEQTTADRVERERAIAKEAAPRRSSKQPVQSRTQHSVARTARRKADQAEARVHRLEQRAAELEAKLSDASLYADPATAARAEELSCELETTRAELEQAFAEWTRAAEAMDQR
jgi:ATP-binding cassette subfamily F protein 3